MIIPALVFSIASGFSSCKKEEEEPMPTPVQMKSSTYDYEFNNGQVVESAAYAGMHNDNLTAALTVEEMSGGQSKITVELTNTVDGAMYMIHAHDAADPGSTPNGTPYNETPNSEVFSKMVTGNGGTVSVSQTVNSSYTEITTNYNGFFVVHDPLQNVSTSDVSTFLVVGTFAREQQASNLASMTYDYAFNTGQLVAEYAYSGSHSSTISARLRLQELTNGMTRVSVMLMNSVSGEMYMVHAHDTADPATTPNGTPYNETPNGDVLTLMINGNGSTAMNSQFSPMSITELSGTYSGFFVVHDPLQPISTTDPTTYVVLGVFAN